MFSNRFKQSAEEMINSGITQCERGFVGTRVGKFRFPPDGVKWSGELLKTFKDNSIQI